MSTTTAWPRLGMTYDEQGHYQVEIVDRCYDSVTR